LYEEDNTIENKVYVKDLIIESDFEILFPDEYVNNVSERLTLYNELATLKTEADLIKYEQKLIDRFGALPKQAQNLLDSVRIKWIASAMGIEKLFLKQGKMIGYFLSDQQSDFYQSNRFKKVLLFIQAYANIATLKEKQTKNGLRLLLTFDQVKSIPKALDLLRKLDEL